MNYVLARMDAEVIEGHVAAALAGDQAAFRELVEAMSGLVWGIARSYLSNPSDRQDVVQTVWLVLAQHLSTLREPRKLPGWLASVTRNECIATGRRSRRNSSLISDRVEQHDESATALLADEARAAVRTALVDLDDKCRELLSLLSLADPPSYEEVSVALDMPIGSIGPTRQRCLDKLRRHAAITALDTSR